MTFSRRLLGAAVAALVLAVLPGTAGAEPPPATDVAPGYGVLTGSVKTSGPEPDSNARVYVEQIGGRYRSQAGLANDSTYYFVLPVGDYLVTFVPSKPTLAWEYFPNARTTAQSKPVRVVSQKTVTGVNAVLDPAGTLTGTVRYPAGVDPAKSLGTVVAYFLDGKTWRPVPVADRRPARPKFVVGGLPTGTYRLKYQAAPGGYGNGTASGFLGGTDDAASSTPVKTVTGQSTTVDITPRPGGTLGGRLKDREGRPVAQVQVDILSPDTDGEGWVQWGRTTSDASGRYQFQGLDTGDYYLNFDPAAPFQHMSSGGVFKDYFAPHDVPSPEPGAAKIAVKAAQATTWRDETLRRAGTLEGTIRDNDGNPVEGIKVEARRGYGYITKDTASIAATPITRTTDAQGHYSFGSLPYAPYDLQVWDLAHFYSDSSYWNDEYISEHGAGLYASSAFVPPQQHVVANIDIGGLPRPSLKAPAPMAGQTAKIVFTAGGKDVTKNTEVVWTWRRDDTVIPGATGPTYKVTSADVGKRLSVSVVLTRRGKDITFRSDPSEPVRKTTS